MKRLRGPELENSPTTADVCYASHWDQRLFMNDLMAPVSSHTAVYSALSLAALEDSGWYRANYTYTEPLLWGRGQGCDFVQQPCLGGTAGVIALQRAARCITLSPAQASRRISPHLAARLLLCLTLLPFPTFTSRVPLAAGTQHGFCDTAGSTGCTAGHRAKGCACHRIRSCAPCNKNCC